MSKKIAIFAFKGDTICFAHSMLNTLDLYSKGHEVKLVIEGTAVKTIVSLFNETQPFSNLFRQILDKKLLAGVCEACSKQMGVYDTIKEKKLPFASDMNGHAGMAPYIVQGYEVIVI